MKTILRFLVRPPAFLFLAFAAILWSIACGSITAQDASGTFTDGEACVVGIIGAAGGTVDVSKLLSCGLAAGDVYNIVSKLVKQEKAAATDAGASALSPAQIAYEKSLQDALTKLEPLAAPQAK